MVIDSDDICRMLVLNIDSITASLHVLLYVWDLVRLNLGTHFGLMFQEPMFLCFAPEGLPRGPPFRGGCRRAYPFPSHQYDYPDGDQH